MCSQGVVEGKFPDWSCGALTCGMSPTLNLNQSAVRFIECEDWGMEHEIVTCEVVGFLGALL